MKGGSGREEKMKIRKGNKNEKNSRYGKKRAWNENG